MMEGPLSFLRTIPGFEGLYVISMTGEVLSLRRRKFLTPHLQSSGYLQVLLSKGGRRTWYLVHRLVAEAFIPNPERLSQVNHKNGDKLDNWIENLEWVSGSENLRHRHRVLGQPGGRSRPVICLDSGVEYPSAKAAALALNVNRSGVAMCCPGKYKSTKNLHFKFKED